MDTFDDRARGDAAGLEHAREAASRFAAYLRDGPPRGGEGGDRPRLLEQDWPMPPGTRSVYAIGQALVLRGTFTEADTFPLKRAFPGQLVTLDDSEGPEGALVVWPPALSGRDRLAG
ncbi:hypothetical protein V1J52_06255 [Streptomyces sp. TRM 70351]|uniref:hypothetical protein n=1 Tax=Streptomyces sp. TRM 70351 TaxID=3116552 RepID=UPI002E7C0B7F|nr:hypothetical protein [Streptomyces sp. TRM 70351]MEE1927796.1 hypothetical protein [Streptomyces sp. TRM 70351]